MRGGGREIERVRGELLLAISVLQIEMRIEVDENLLPWFRGCYHPHAQLGGRVGAGIARGGQVVRGVDLYSLICQAIICGAREGRKLVSWWADMDFPATQLHSDIDCKTF